MSPEALNEFTVTGSSRAGRGREGGAPSRTYWNAALLWPDVKEVTGRIAGRVGESFTWQSVVVAAHSSSRHSNGIY